ncbi:pre-rRNA-processing protein TSR2 homolog isoform X2 [Anarhichas minor]|uniref:pre-rRNA-processing protein TSR2 homolog isoform X2 n=1 Tax=Anarhichas minor TaxID=65739 RepID=UPI003F73E364
MISNILFNQYSMPANQMSAVKKGSDISVRRSNMAASNPSRELFTAGVRAVLHSWPVLQIAVDNGFGGVYGQQKADWMVDVVQQYFHDNADLQQCEVEDFIAELMDQEFDTVVDDGSLPQVCDSLVQSFSQWQQGALEQLQQTINTLTQKKSQRATAPPTHSDEDSGDETQVMECESSVPSVSSRDPPPPRDEEAGWTVVRKKK